MLDSIKIAPSTPLGREARKMTLMEELTTVISLGWSGRAEEKVHSSSTAVVSLTNCGPPTAGEDVGGGDKGWAFAWPRSRRGCAAGDGAGLIELWKWKGEACRGVGEVSAPKGSNAER